MPAAPSSSRGSAAGTPPATPTPGPGYGSTATYGHAGVLGRLGAELLGAEAEPGEHDEVGVQLAPWRR